MIYLEESFDLVPASPETMDSFVDAVREQLLPSWDRLSARLVAAWYTDSDAFGRVMHVLEFDDLAALGAFRSAASTDESWTECDRRIEELAPGRSSRLMEALPAVPPAATHAAAAQSQNAPVSAYSLAILDVVPGKMQAFNDGLAAAAKNLPIIASWRTIVGTQNQVTDVWKGALRTEGYRRADDRTKQFFRQIRSLAPRERLVIAHPLPYSPLQ